MPPTSGDTSIVAPRPGSRNILITSALPYVNDVPHLGNIIGSVLSADVFARYCRARGLNTLYIGGTDEYGTATEIGESQEGCTPKELCDRFHEIHADIYKWFDISFDKFRRTTTQNQTDIAQQIFSRVNDNGYLDERVTRRLYCESHGRFLADRYVVGDCPHCGKDAKGDESDACGSFDDAIELKNPRCNLDACGATPVTRDTKHLFFRLDRLQLKVQAFFDGSAVKGRWSSNGIGQTLGWFKRGLKERSITRDIKFGTPVPPKVAGYEDKVIYNWFDAPIGYVSITAEYTDNWRGWWQPQDPNDVQLYQFIGKDNIFFHSIFFPATQIATGDNWTKVHHLSTTEYLQYEGTKFSKSKRIGVFGDQAKASGIKADVWRFYLLYHRPEHHDTEFKWDTFIDANNSHLNNNLGNFVNRVIKSVNNPQPRGYSGIVPDDSWLRDSDGTVGEWKRDVNILLGSYLRHLDAVELRAALVIAIEISAAGNKLAQKASRLPKSDKEERGAYLTICLNLIRLLAALLLPFIPETAGSIARQLGVEPVLSIPDTFDCDFIRKGHQLGEAECLFTRIDPKRADDWKAQCSGSRSNGVTSGERGGDENSRNAAPDASRSEGSEEANKSQGEQEDLPKSNVSVLDRSAAVEGGLAQALQPLSLK
jgi:methionyl-tRNA synthetase